MDRNKAGTEEVADFTDPTAKVLVKPSTAKVAGNIYTVEINQNKATEKADDEVGEKVLPLHSIARQTLQCDITIQTCLKVQQM